MERSESAAISYFSRERDLPPGDPASLLAERSNRTLSWMQQGLIYPAPWQCAITVMAVPATLRKAQIADIVSRARREIHKNHGSQHASVSVAFSFALWERWCNEGSLPVPSGQRFDEPGTLPYAPAVLERSNGVLVDSAASAWFLVKADTEQAVLAMKQFVQSALQDIGIAAEDAYAVTMHSRTSSGGGAGISAGRVLGGRFHENLRNPASPVEILEHVLVGEESGPSMGGTFVFTQRFQLNWASLHAKPASELESAVGRQQYTDEFMPSFDAQSHVRRSHTYDAQGNTVKLLRIGLPFGRRSDGDAGTPLVEHSGGNAPGLEAGLYFIGMARTAARIECVLKSQFGGNDHLLTKGIVKSDLGGFFYAPSIRELGAEQLVDDVKQRAGQPHSDWHRSPGIDWSRFIRHYDKRSANGRMYYNHQDYLYCMATGSPETVGIAPPSLRVQFLLERMFSKWDDTWYRAQKPNELAPLRAQLELFFSRPANHAERDAILGGAADQQFPEKAAAARVMQQPVAVRAGWAGRLLCNLAAAPDGVGGRGNGGMDLCGIHPLDLLAGSMPAQSLAEGRYLIDYTSDTDNEAERYRWFSMGLGPNSGVGHVVPGYELLLAEGIEGVRERVRLAEQALAASGPERAAEAAPFYESARLALRGLEEYLALLADRVNAAATAVRQGAESLEYRNLAELEARLRRLAAGHRPASVLEALQMVLSCHAILHLCGEPVAVGRLDKLLRPFQVDTPLSMPALQEAIDCFWIKLGEKVLLNRVFIDDRQEQGNMAMGNRAGPYPKGQSVNQWIQQLTVGGKNVDGSWEYSDVTVACLEASARLPFNAPVLSLRVSRDMPGDWRGKLLALAAQGQLSGGANPILLNDDKIIPGLFHSGDNIAPTPGGPGSAKWDAQVRIEDAHDYACDGCYEPQFVGANWFHLGGTIMLQPLEYALNQGRSIQSAGPVDLFGKNMSFRSKPAEDISSYGELEELFFKHFEWGYTRQMEGTLADFGRLQNVYTAPFLNLFINDCLAKGQDLYAGGARYNVLGPCFTSLANTINALWAIRIMCFNEHTAVTSLPELVQALLCNWGESMIDPLVHSTVTAARPDRVAETAQRFRELRAVALGLPRWGRGHAEIDRFGNDICARVSRIAQEVMTKPRQPILAHFERLANRFGTERLKFGGFSMQPGVGTFASYVEQGMGCSASADGRLSGQPLATDMSPSPTPVDLPATAASQQLADGVQVLDGMSSGDSFGFSNGAPIDFNVAEGMPQERLVQILDAFTGGAGSNVLTVTVADQYTFLAAARSPEAYDLLRVRMGGWTEMFVAMHAVHQKVHPRRPYSH